MGNSMPSMLMLMPLMLPRCEVMANEHEHVAYRSRKRASAVTFLFHCTYFSLFFYFYVALSLSLTLSRSLSCSIPFSFENPLTHFAHPKIVPRVMTMVSTDLFLLFGFCSLPSLILFAFAVLFFCSSNFSFSFLFQFFVPVCLFVAIVVGRLVFFLFLLSFCKLTQFR